jgi:hypothetical protein
LQARRWQLPRCTVLQQIHNAASGRFFFFVEARIEGSGYAWRGSGLSWHEAQRAAAQKALDGMYPEHQERLAAELAAEVTNPICIEQ